MKPATRPQDHHLQSGRPATVVVAAAPEQVEMPFAMVNGEPITQLPRDLYIPPQALEVFLEAFEGPLDLLLYLIRRQNLNILDIPLAEITRQYMQYIELMAELQLELAGEYLVMAATLAEIKSRMFLPRAAVERGGRSSIRAPSSCAACRNTSASSAPRKASTPCRAWSATCGRRLRRLKERQAVRMLPQITLQEMLLAFKDVVARARCLPITTFSASVSRWVSA